jgi:putative colanic acid biosynthesis UDP-glucose lipid carrier transferase
MNQTRYKGFIRPYHSKMQTLAHTFDYALIVASLYVSLILYQVPFDREYLLACILGAALFGIFAENNGLYQGDWRGAPMFDDSLRILFSWLGAFTLLISGVYLYNSEYEYSLEVIELWLPLAPTSIILTHTLQRGFFVLLKKTWF